MVHISPSSTYSIAPTIFRAHVGHELIHAFHNFSGLNDKSFIHTKNTERVAHHYTENTLRSGGYTDLADQARARAIKHGFWYGTSPDSYNTLPGFFW